MKLHSLLTHGHSTAFVLGGLGAARGQEGAMPDLTDAGVKVNLKTYDGVAHEFLGMGAVVDKAKEALGVAAADLKAAFGN